MRHHPFNPFEKLSTELRRPEVRAALKASTSLTDVQLDGIANGDGNLPMAVLREILIASGLEMIRSDFFEALIVMAQVGAAQIGGDQR